ncbi:helix-turn-helix domain-containing protein [Acinetobacter soli]|uniref:transcriptional regulator n=1 Tax=Acinetobacter soli TaxID=487316 RepID=UPI00124FB7D2|nr:transcriptional regulator [Acinetobacter soli]MBU3121350.1 helix-turn-helix domain-containing protein [Acinetobacter soli]
MTGQNKRISKEEREKLIFESLSEEAKQKVMKFRASIKLYFKTQKHAAEILGCTQPNVSRYCSGRIGVPHRIAKKLQEHTKKKVLITDIFYDRKA